MCLVRTALDDVPNEVKDGMVACARRLYERRVGGNPYQVATPWGIFQVWLDGTIEEA
jgi:hypothetical protein